MAASCHQGELAGAGGRAKVSTIQSLNPSCSPHVTVETGGSLLTTDLLLWFKSTKERRTRHQPRNLECHVSKSICFDLTKQNGIQFSKEVSLGLIE